jgi:hypothetical protein
MLPLAVLATAQILHLTNSFGRFPRTSAAVLITGICAFNLSQYQVFFVKSAIYEPIPIETLHAIKIIKRMPQR